MSSQEVKYEMTKTDTGSKIHKEETWTFPNSIVEPFRELVSNLRDYARFSGEKDESISKMMDAHSKAMETLLKEVKEKNEELYALRKEVKELRQANNDLRKRSNPTAPQRGKPWKPDQRKEANKPEVNTGSAQETQVSDPTASTERETLVPIRREPIQAPQHSINSQLHDQLMNLPRPADAG